MVETTTQLHDQCPHCGRWSLFEYSSEGRVRHMACYSCGKGHVPSKPLAEIKKSARALEEMYRLKVLPPPPGFDDTPHRKIRRGAKF